MHKKIILFFTCLFSLVPAVILGQVSDPQKQYTAFEMRSNGKIYVVVTVVLIILIGLILYLVRLDRKISRLEKENR